MAATTSTGPFPVLAHPYRSPTPGSCAYETGNTSSKNAIIFIGGLTDGPHTVPYVRTISRFLEREPDLSYSVFEIRMGSSFQGFGTRSLVDDVHDISALVKYLRSIGREKIVLFGHSTGCQDCMEYTKYAKHSNSPVDGFILQAPVSDREGLEMLVPNHQEYLDYANEMIADGRGDHCMPKDKIPTKFFGEVMTAQRLHSLLAKGGDDDYFSSDLDDETVSRFWGIFNRPVLILHSAEDEYVPPSVNQEAVNKKWQRINPVISPLSGLIPEAGHAVLGEKAREWLAEKVVEFLRAIN